MRELLFLNGPNLNLLGLREPHIYGTETLLDVEMSLKVRLQHLNQSDVELVFKQTNHEGQLIDWIQEARESSVGLGINAGGLTHTSVALRDALATYERYKVEIHISNVYKREAFRHESLIAPVCDASLCGFGVLGYQLALDALLEWTKPVF
jgi:3-dehydroquinate dehydratase II